MIAALFLNQSRIGCAYFDETTDKLRVLLSVEFSIPNLEMLMSQIGPCLILLNSDEYKSQIEQCCGIGVTLDDTMSSGEHNTDGYTIEIVLFGITNTDQILQRLKTFEFENITSTDNLTALTTKLHHHENKMSIIACGELLHYLENRETFRVRTLETFSLSEYMYVSGETMWELCIFNQSSHPNAQSSKKVEHKSLFQILNQTKTFMGSQLLKSWFKCPLLSLEGINARQSKVEYFTLSENHAIAHELVKHLKLIVNIPTLLERLRVKSEVSDWHGLVKFLDAVKAIKRILQQSRLSAWSNLFPSDFDDIVFALQQQTIAIDFPLSQHEKRIVFKINHNSRLDELKRLYAGLDDFLSKFADSISLPDSDALAFKLVYFPQLGFLIALEFENGGLHIADEVIGLEHQFTANGLKYYKNEDMKNLDQEIGDIHFIINDIELLMLQELRDSVLGLQNQLLAIVKVIAELDCVLALAAAAIENQYCKPRIVQESIIDLKTSRHAIAEHEFDTFIPNDIEISTFKCLALTGPNASGKTIILTQVALIVFMAHIGSFVPCSQATVGLTDKILTRVRTRFSTSLQDSAFMIDLRQACNIVTESTPQSLVIMDELGKGTIPQDGMGLLAAITKELITKNCNVIVATHFHELFDDELMLNFTDRIAFYSLEIRLQDEITYLYKLRPGQCLQSLGIQCAKQSGCPHDVVERAIDIQQAISTHSPIPSVDQDRTNFELIEMMFQMFVNLDLNEDLDLEKELWAHLRLLDTQ